MPSPTARLARPATRLRLSRRLAVGVSAARAARAEGVAEAEVEALLADPDFADLVEAQREIDALPEAEQVARLVRLARICIENAMDRGDWRVGCFVTREARRGRNPARTVAGAVIAARRRAARVPAEAPPAPTPKPAPATAAPAPAARPAAGYAESAFRRVTAKLRAAVVSELALRQGGAERSAAAERMPSPRPSPSHGGPGGGHASPATPLVPPLPPAEGEGGGEGKRAARTSPPRSTFLRRHATATAVSRWLPPPPTLPEWPGDTLSPPPPRPPSRAAPRAR